MENDPPLADVQHEVQDPPVIEDTMESVVTCLAVSSQACSIFDHIVT